MTLNSNSSLHISSTFNLKLLHIL